MGCRLVERGHGRGRRALTSQSQGEVLWTHWLLCERNRPHQTAQARAPWRVGVSGLGLGSLASCPVS